MTRVEIGREAEERADGRYIHLEAIQPEEGREFFSIYLNGHLEPDHYIGNATNFQRSPDGILSMDIQLFASFGLTEELLDYGFYATDIASTSTSDRQVIQHGVIRAIFAFPKVGFHYRGAE